MLLYIVELILAFSLPLLLYLNTKLYKFRFFLLFGFGVYSILGVFIHGFSSDQLGFSENFFFGWEYYSLFILFGIILIVLSSKLSSGKAIDIPGSHGEKESNLLFYIILSAPLQEFIARSYVFARTVSFSLSPFFPILIPSLVYSWMHITFRDKRLVLITFIFGFLLSIVYYFYPNIWLVSIVHIILGALSRIASD